MSYYGVHTPMIFMLSVLSLWLLWYLSMILYVISL